MPSAPSRPCRHPGCPELVEGAARYCPAHCSPLTAHHAERRARDRFRGTAHERGYDARWQRASRAFLARWPLCSGVLIPTAEWTAGLAREFHDLREAAHERGDILLFGEHPSADAARHTSAIGAGVALSAQRSELRHFLAEHPIYRLEPWDVARAAAVVDHIVPHKGDLDLFWSEWNWQPLTKRAHDRKTATEDRPGREAEALSRQNT